MCSLAFKLKGNKCKITLQAILSDMLSESPIGLAIQSILQLSHGLYDWYMIKAGLYGYLSQQLRLYR